MDDNMKNRYMTELSRRIDHWGGGLKAEDFQYDPEREQIRNQMCDWLASQMPDATADQLKLQNRKYFGVCMAGLVYEQKVRPNIDAFLLH
jgi:hypothetical protein